MNVALTPELAEIVRKKMKSGHYDSVVEVIADALRLMDWHERLHAAEIAKLRADVEDGWQQVEKGRVVDFDASDIKRRGRARLASVKLRSTD